jgi:hypothetical protein
MLLFSVEKKETDGLLGDRDVSGSVEYVKARTNTSDDGVVLMFKTNERVCFEKNGSTLDGLPEACTR